MNCPKCNYPAAPNQKFCENCGAPIAQVQIDVERTMAADVDDIPAVPQQPVVMAPVEAPAAQTPAAPQPVYQEAVVPQSVTEAPAAPPADPQI